MGVLETIFTFAVVIGVYGFIFYVLLKIARDGLRTIFGGRE